MNLYGVKHTTCIALFKQIRGVISRRGPCSEVWHSPEGKLPHFLTELVRGA